MRLAERYLLWIILILLKYVHLTKATFWMDRCAVDCECICVSVLMHLRLEWGLVACLLLLAGQCEQTVLTWRDYVSTAGPARTSAESIQRAGFEFG